MKISIGSKRGASRIVTWILHQRLSCYCLLIKCKDEPMRQRSCFTLRPEDLKAGYVQGEISGVLYKYIPKRHEDSIFKPHDHCIGPRRGRSLGAKTYERMAEPVGILPPLLWPMAREDGLGYWGGGRKGGKGGWGGNRIGGYRMVVYLSAENWVQYEVLSS